MARPTTLDLTADKQPWRRVPMDGADLPLDVVPLASDPADFVILARFPAGFVRDVPGGYHAGETFLVLDGELTLDGRQVRRGDLTHIPAEALRSDMRSVDGCLALAWFSGPATFLAPSELGTAEGAVRTVVPDASSTGTVLETPEAVWSVREGGGGECVDLALSTWSLSGDGRPGPHLVRERR